MLFIRMQHAYDQMGIYHSDYAIDRINLRLNEDICHPLPMNDSLLSGRISHIKLCNSEYKFGFTNWQQFRNWLYNDEILQELLDAGFEVCVMRVNNLIVGNAQCLWDFKKDTAEVLLQCHSTDINEIQSMVSREWTKQIINELKEPVC